MLVFHLERGEKQRVDETRSYVGTRWGVNVELNCMCFLKNVSRDFGAMCHLGSTGRVAIEETSQSHNPRYLHLSFWRQALVKENSYCIICVHLNACGMRRSEDNLEDSVAVFHRVGSIARAVDKNICPLSHPTGPIVFLAYIMRLI